MMKTYKLKNKSRITRKHIVSIFNWCKENLGGSDFFPSETLRIRISTKMKIFVGEFDVLKNCININPKKAIDELDLITTVIHEYVHFQQDFNEYERLDLLLPRRRNYLDHPHEKEAEETAQKLKIKCFIDIREELNW